MSDDTVAFLGQRTVTPKENEQLRLLGRLLSRAGGELHTSMNTAANLAVVEGFRAGGKQPVFHTSKLHESSPWVLLYGDEQFIDSVCAQWPDPDPRQHWDHVKDLEALTDLNLRISLALKARVDKEQADAQPA